MSKKLKFIYMAGGASYTIEPLKTIIKSKHKLIHVFTKLLNHLEEVKNFKKSATKFFG